MFFHSKNHLGSTTGIAVITGGIGGIGTEISKRLAEDGNYVIATYIPSEYEKAKSWLQKRIGEGINANLIECDVTNFDSCKKMATIIEEKYGHIDILINCAGITSDATLKNMDTKSWHSVIETNLDSVFNITRHFVNGMIKKRYGRIVNISSVNGQKGQFGQTNYSAAKSGMIGFTRSLAMELAKYNITVNCVCPGYVATNMVESIPAHIQEAIPKPL